MRASEIIKKYPSGSTVIDCYGQKSRVIGSYLQVSEFKPAGTLVLGGAWIFDSVTKRWAVVTKE